MKTAISFAVATTLLLCGGMAQVQPAVAGPKLKATCSITGRANDVSRIELLRLSNGFYGHRAYDAGGKLICDSEWSATAELNLLAAEILRAKGDDKADIVDRVGLLHPVGNQR